MEQMCLWNLLHLAVETKQEQQDPEKLNYIKYTIAGRKGKQVGDTEFELVWRKCLVSIGKQCQFLCNKAKKGCEISVLIIWNLLVTSFCSTNSLYF